MSLTARLARVEVSGAECEDWAPKVGAVLDWFAQLQEVDLDGVEPLLHMHDAESAAPPREDVARDSGLQEQIFSQAPETAQGQISIPRIAAEE